MANKWYNEIVMKKEIIKYGLIVFIIDLVSKLIVDNVLKVNETMNVINNFFSITKVYNTGASFSTMNGYRFVFIIVAIVALYYLYKYINSFKNNKRNIISFSLLMGGIVGNMLDRIVYGYVIDFIDFNLFNSQMPIFNIADSAICIGVFLLVIALMKKEDTNGISSK